VADEVNSAERTSLLGRAYENRSLEMPFVVDPEPGEEIYVLREFRGSHSHVFAMAVSSQAVYLPMQRMVLRRDAWCFRHVPLAEVRSVSMVKQQVQMEATIGCG
jgi:hypothetical protein